MTPREFDAPTVVDGALVHVADGAHVWVERWTGDTWAKDTPETLAKFGLGRLVE